MKRVVFLIISSYDHPIYKSMRDILRMIYVKMSKVYPIAHYFVELVPNLSSELHVDGDTIYVRGTESIKPGIIIKTYRALQYINEKIDYDVLIRTNISTVWNIHHLYDMLPKFATEKLAAGIRPFDTFISGSGIIVSKDVSKRLCEALHSPRDDCEDDIILSEYLKNIVPICGLDHSKWCLLVDGEHNVIPTDTSHILYFRVKSSGDRIHDIAAFKTLAKNLYDIEPSSSAVSVDA